MPIIIQRKIDNHTISDTLRHWPFAASAANTDTINDIALLGLVSKPTSFVWTRWAGSTVDDVQLAKLYYALSAMFNECIAQTPQCPQCVLMSESRRDIRRAV